MLSLRLLLAFILTTSSAMADSMIAPRPQAFSGPLGSGVVFKMVPAKFNDKFKKVKEAYGVAYQLDTEGVFKILYTTKGWYSSQVFISLNGRYIVRMGPWNIGSTPSKEDLAVAFYKDGKLLKKYSTAKLVKDKTKVIASTSHYFWRAPSPLKRDLTDAERLKLRLHLDYGTVFDIHTIDGFTYSFDITTGKIKKRVKTQSLSF